MRKNTKILTLFLYIIVLPTIIWGMGCKKTQPIDQKELVLLTPEEANQLQLTDDEWEQPIKLSRGISKGPRIVIQRPNVDDIKTPIKIISPTDFFISFEENLAPVDMDSLKVIAKKGFFSRSLIDRLRPYIKGTTLEAKAIVFPEGKFRVEICVADQNGKETTNNYRLKVEEQ